MITIQKIDDNVCFKWFLVGYLHPAYLNLARITKADIYVTKEIDFKDINLPVKIRDIHKIKKKKEFYRHLVEKTK